MAEAIISPGVFTRENDISFIQPAPVEAGAAIIGPAVKGPVEKPTLVTSYNDYVRRFGATFESASTSYEFMTSIAVKNYFSQGGNSVLVTRVANGTFDPADSTAMYNKKETGVLDTVANSLLASIGTNPVNAGAASYTSISTTTSGAGTGAVVTAVVTGTTAPTITGITVTAAGTGYVIGDTLTIAAAALGTGQLKDAQDVLSISNGAAYVLGSVTGPFTVAQTSTTGTGTGATFTITGDGTNVSALAVASIGTGHADTDVITITAADLVTAGFTGATGDLTVTLGTINVQDSDAAVITLVADDIVSDVPFVLETLGEGKLFNNAVSIVDPGAQNSDGSLVSGSADNLRWEVSNISDSQGTFSLSIRQGDDNTKSKTILETFNNVSLDPNSSNYIEALIGNQSTTLSATADGTYIRTSGEYINRSNYVRVSAVNFKTLDYLANDGVTVNTDSSGASFSDSLPVVSSGSFSGALGGIIAGANFFDNINDTNTQGLVATDYTDVINLLTNTEEYIFNIISAPGLAYNFATHITPIDSIISLAEGRGDCVAVLDVQEYGATVSNVVAKATTINSSYAATYWPWLQVLSATGRNEWVPASVVIPGVYAFTDNSSAPWFAPAGLVRGGVAGVIQAERRLTRTQRDTLYSNKVNPIASFPGQGISVFGQKTLQTKASALDRVNVRRLLIELKKFIGDESRNLVFEQNTIATRNRFLATVNPYLESVVQRQGLYAYRVVMDDTNNTADVVDRNQLIGQIFIQPVKTAEFIILDFTIEPTGATFAG